MGEANPPISAVPASNVPASNMKGDRASTGSGGDRG